MKVFHDRVSTYHSSVPERELDLLRRMKHRNIIGILGREKEVKSLEKSEPRKKNGRSNSCADPDLFFQVWGVGGGPRGFFVSKFKKFEFSKCPNLHALSRSAYVINQVFYHSPHCSIQSGDKLYRFMYIAKFNSYMYVI